MKQLLRSTGLVCVALALALTPALAETIEVKMLNKGDMGTMVFEPALIRAKSGDIIKFISVDKGHNAETIDGLIPQDASAFKGKINKNIEVTVEVPGVYAVKCTPHLAMGMVALIVVDDDISNLDIIKASKHPKKAQQRFDALYAEIGQ